MKKSFILIVVAGLLWGTSGVFVSYLTPYGFSSIQLTAVRGLVAALAMVAYMLIVDKSAFRASPARLLVYFVCGLMLFTTAFLYYSSIQRTSIATAAILMYTAPIFVTGYSVAFLGERMTPVKLGAIVMMLSGCVLVSGVIGGFKSDTLGIFLGLGSGLCYAAYNVVSKIGMKRGCSPRSLSLYGFIFMAAAAIPLSDPIDIPTHATDARAWILLSLLGVVTFVTPYFLYNLSLKDIDAGTASSLGVVEPMSATVYAMIFFGQIPDLIGGIGVVLVLAAVLLLGREETVSARSALNAADEERLADEKTKAPRN